MGAGRAGSRCSHRGNICRCREGPGVEIRQNKKGQALSLGRTHKQDGDCRLAAPGQIHLVYLVGPSCFYKTIELHREIQASGGNPREASTLGPSCRQEAVSWGLRPPLATVPAIPYCPPPAHPPHLCSRPAPLGICICTSGPGGDRGWKRLREGGPGSPARQHEREQRRVWRGRGGPYRPPGNADKVWSVRTVKTSPSQPPQRGHSVLAVDSPSRPCRPAPRPRPQTPSSPQLLAPAAEKPLPLNSSRWFLHSSPSPRPPKADARVLTWLNCCWGL